MATPLCSTGCETIKYTFCGNIATASGGPCAHEFSLDWLTGVSRALAWGDESIMAIPSVGLPACSPGPFPAGARTVVSSSLPGEGMTVSQISAAVGPGTACDGPIGICPSCIFVEMGINLCIPSGPSIVAVGVEEALAGPAPSGRCARIWILHLSCGFKGKFCIEACCDDPYPAT
jgi:hypothetical protein